MAPRLELQTLLETFTPKVYFQPPVNIRVEYPCIVYRRDFASTRYADDLSYTYTKRYLITVIDQDPDSEIPEKIAEMPMSSFTRFFATEGLNHDVYQVYF